ncbi:hypothetical protein PRBEI_2001632700 [Prionailurus iriomotensis]
MATAAPGELALKNRQAPSPSPQSTQYSEALEDGKRGPI